MLTTRQRNLSKLPEVCYGTLLSDGSLILLKRDETGYWPTEGYSTNGLFLTFSDVADMLNEKMGVTKAQRAAMELGSIAGFDAPGANPDLFDENGVMKRE